MNIIQLYEDFNIDFRTEGHKHCRDGWVNTPCPFCEGNSGYHLGYCIDTNHYVCWRCGFHPVLPTIACLLNLSTNKAFSILSWYNIPVEGQHKLKQAKTGIKRHIIPTGCTPLTERHKKYLEGRGFDPEYLEQKYKLLSTGPVSLLDHIDYRHRILIPYIWNGVQVSFDARDVTGKSISKYMACPAEREIISHKNILYGKDFRSNDKFRTGIIVEGTTDTWRLGTNSFAVSGIKYTQGQVRLISKLFKRVFIVFDGGETQAQEQARLLAGELSFRGIETKVIDLLNGDPASMSQGEANYFVKQLIH